MVYIEDLSKIYDILIDNKEITTKSLNDAGYTQNDINKLMTEGIIDRETRGNYVLLVDKQLYNYGVNLIINKDYFRAYKCFLKCYEINPNNYENCLQLFFRSIQNKDYELALKYYDDLFKNEEYDKDNNFYLYLLSKLTTLPEHLILYAKFFKYDDFKLDIYDKRYTDIFNLNKVRLSSYNQKYFLASRQLKDLIQNNKNASISNMIIKSLLQQVIDNQKEMKEKNIDFITKKDYCGLCEYMENIQNSHNLRVIDEYVIKLSKLIIEIKNNKSIPQKQIFTTNDLYEAIDGNNFSLALDLCSEYYKNSQINQMDKDIYLLLKDINNIVNSLENETYIDDEINNEDVIQKVSYENIVIYLIKSDLENALKALRIYLKDINKEEYEFLLINYITIDILEKDLSFIKTLTLLSYISRDSYTFDISEYIKDFYESLTKGNLDVAQIYLDIISKSNKFGLNFYMINDLKKILENTQKELNFEYNTEVINSINASLKIIELEPRILDSNIPTVFASKDEIKEINKKENNVEIEMLEPITEEDEEIVEEIEIEEAIEDEKIIAKKRNENDIIVFDYEYDSSFKSFLDSKIEDLYNKCIVLLEPLEYETSRALYDVINKCKNVVMFSIGHNEDRHLVLRYKPYINDYVDISTLSREGNIAFNNENYDLCIKKYNQLIKFGTPKGWVYAKLGLAYMKKNDRKAAIDFLTIATIMNQEEGLDYDYTDIIENLKNNPLEHIEMSEDDFNNDLDEYYGIKNIEDIAKLLSSGMSIEDIAANYSMSDEEKLIIYLIFAREYYMEGNYYLGDIYLSKVDKSKEKTKYVSNILNEIKRNKRFYKNRITDGHKSLTLVKED